MRRQREMERKLAAMSGGVLKVPTRRRRTGRRAQGAASARAADGSGPADEPMEGSSAEEDLAEQDAAAAAAGSDQEQAGEDGGWEDASEALDQEGDDEDELQLLLRAPHSSRTLPKIMFEMDEEDRPPAAGAGGSAILEEGDEPDSDGIGSDGALPSRIAARVYKRHRWAVAGRAAAAEPPAQQGLHWTSGLSAQQRSACTSSPAGTSAASGHDSGLGSTACLLGLQPAVLYMFEAMRNTPCLPCHT